MKFVLAFVSVSMAVTPSQSELEAQMEAAAEAVEAPEALRPEAPRTLYARADICRALALSSRHLGAENVGEAPRSDEPDPFASKDRHYRISFEQRGRTISGDWGRCELPDTAGPSLADVPVKDLESIWLSSNGRRLVVEGGWSFPEAGAWSTCLLKRRGSDWRLLWCRRSAIV